MEQEEGIITNVHKKNLWTLDCRVLEWQKTAGRINYSTQLKIKKYLISHWAERVRFAFPPLINFVMIFRYLYTSHYRFNFSSKNILRLVFSTMLHLYPTDTKSQDICGSIVQVFYSFEDIMCKETKYIQVPQCSQMSYLSNGTKQWRWHLGFCSKIENMYSCPTEKMIF